MRRWAFSITRAACCGGREEANGCSTTSCMGLRFLLRCCLARRECWGFLPACYGESARETKAGRRRKDEDEAVRRLRTAAARCGDGRAARTCSAAWILSGVQHDGAEEILG